VGKVKKLKCCLKTSEDEEEEEKNYENQTIIPRFLLYKRFFL
jgi:hypothetical protein